MRYVQRTGDVLPCIQLLNKTINTSKGNSICACLCLFAYLKKVSTDRLLLISSSLHLLISSTPHLLISSSPHLLISSTPHLLNSSLLISSSPQLLISSTPLSSSPHLLILLPNASTPVRLLKEEHHRKIPVFYLIFYFLFFRIVKSTIPVFDRLDDCH